MYPVYTFFTKLFQATSRLPFILVTYKSHLVTCRTSPTGTCSLQQAWDKQEDCQHGGGVFAVHHLVNSFCTSNQFYQSVGPKHQDSGGSLKTIWVQGQKLHSRHVWVCQQWGDGQCDQLFENPWWIWAKASEYLPGLIAFGTCSQVTSRILSFGGHLLTFVCGHLNASTMTG